MPRLPASGVHARSVVHLDAALAGLAADGYVVYLVDGAPTDKAAFFESARAGLPLDPPLAGARGAHWDALQDSMFGGLLTVPAEGVAIVWPHSDRLHSGDAEAYAIAVKILADLVDWLPNPDEGRVKKLLILLM